MTSRSDFPDPHKLNRAKAIDLCVKLLDLLFGPVSTTPLPPAADADTTNLINYNGKPLTFAAYLANRDAYPGAGDRFRIATLKAQMQPHEYTAWQQGVPLWEVGTNDDWLGKYEKDFKPMWQNAEQAQADGSGFDYVVRQIPLGEAAFRTSLATMVSSEWGKAWLVNPLTVGMRPSQAAIDALTK